MGQGSTGFGLPSICHEPAGDSNGDGHERQQSCDHQGDDESDLGDAHLLVLGAQAGSGVHPGLFPSFDGEDGVGLHRNLFPELAGVHAAFDIAFAALNSSGLVAIVVVFADFSSPPTVGVDTAAILGLALAETHADVALEPDVVLRRELEGAEGGRQHAKAALVLPFAKDGWIRGAAVIVSDKVFVFTIVVHRVGNTASAKPP